MKVAERRDTVANVAVAYTSPAFTIEQMLDFSAQVIPSAAISGTMHLEVSNNAFQPPTGNAMYLVEYPQATWTTVPSTTVVLAASTGFTYEDLDDSSRYVRLVWAPSAGTGTAVINWWAKGRI